jgi:hypothetical protein
MKPLARLGEAMSLNGTVPHGADLRHAVPRRCPCGNLFLALGKAAARARFCDECKATRTCASCNGIGEHRAYCSTLRPRPCRGCGVELGHGTRRFFCEACWAQQCPECGVRAGRHHRLCRYETRRRRPGLTEYQGIVSEQDILDLYLAHGPRAVRIARSICGDLSAEDVVQDVTLYLLEKREYLQRPPGETYFLKAVTRAALRTLLNAWARYRVAMDPQDLVIAEQMMARGLTSENKVRLPEPVA